MVCQEHESAYWDGSKGVCCDGTVYQPDIEDTSYACCPTGKEVSIVQGKENLNQCCSEGQKAYWNGSSAQCCATATHQIVTNYINGVEDAGYACCEVKEDYSKTYYDGDITETDYYSGYSIAGAVNGKCCGGYASITYADYGQSTNSHAVRQNGGVYYCASNYNRVDLYTGDETRTYVSNSQVCYGIGHGYEYCYCTTTGDPDKGNICCEYPDCP